MELVDAAIKDKMHGVAITDNGNMFGMMEFFDYEFHCTCQAARRFFGHNLPNHQLQTVAAECGYCLENHHHALADAEACAWIARKIL